MTKEHIWSDWLTGLIPRNDEHGEYWGSMHRASGSIEVEWTEAPGSSARQGSVLQRKIRKVCKDCSKLGVCDSGPSGQAARSVCSLRFN